MTESVSWPSPSDFSAAIQNPQNCFYAAELKTARVVCNRMGLPMLASGNFAVVYQLQNDGHSYAVRCFIRAVTDQQQRYQALSKHLPLASIPALVPFAYYPQGIRVKGRAYPILRMEWIGGQQLHRYVEEHLRQPDVLWSLVEQWRGVMASLAAAHAAHGDLQHGNILVDGRGQIRLVDYDGLYVAALRGSPPGEVGHPNYQHPDRITKGHYDENVDAFSAQVIQLSLLALRADPSLWSYHNGENLIFVADDFKNPGSSPVWPRLRGSSDPEVRRQAVALETLCRRPLLAAAPPPQATPPHALYSGRISRLTPGCVLFLVDQSSAMAQRLEGGPGRSLAERVADAVNRTIHELAEVSAQAPRRGIGPRYEIGVIGYGAAVAPALSGEHAGRLLMPAEEAVAGPARVEERLRKEVGEDGLIVEVPVQFPVCYEPRAAEGRPMCSALRLARSILELWVRVYPHAFPPVVINITVGPPTDGDPLPDAEALRSLSTRDGNVLLFNAYISPCPEYLVLFPEAEDRSLDACGRALFRMCSPLPERLAAAAAGYGYTPGPGARGFVANADIVELIKFIDIGIPQPAT